MTCIVGVVSGARVHLGGDSLGVSGWDRTHRVDPKVFRVGEFVIGFTSSFRMGQLLQHSFGPPPIESGEDLHRYMVTRFVEGVRKLFSDGGFSKDKDGRESGGVFLVGVRGRLFRVEGDFQVGESSDGYNACGCGESYALGALHASRGIADPQLRMDLALNAAEYHSSGVGRPFAFAVTP